VLLECFVLEREAVKSDLLADTMARHSAFEVAYCVIDGLAHALPLLGGRRAGRVRWDQLAHHGACAAGFALYLAVEGRFRSGPAPALTALLLLQHASTPLLHASWL